MIDETSVVTYQACHGNNLPQQLQFIAQVMLPNGKFWGVYFTGSTQIEVVNKAIACWNAEEAKIKERLPTGAGQVFENQHHFAGKIWMFNKQTGDKVRIDSAQITEYEFKGYERGRGTNK